MDPDNEELQKLKVDLEEVLTLTKDLIKQQLLDSRKSSLPGGSGDSGNAATLISDQDILNSIPAHNFKVGDRCLAMSSDDGEYYEGVIEDMSEDQEQVSVKLIHNGLIEVTAPTFLRPITKPTVKKKSDYDQKHSRKQTQSQREYQKKKKLKKQMRYKQLEEERETEKNKWLAFTSKKKGGLLMKKSIFASPDSVTGRVGIGTCGVSGLPMTEFSHAEKRKKDVHMTFGPDKYKTQFTSRGKQKEELMPLSSGDFVTSRDQGQTSNYFGFHQSRRIGHPEIKKQLAQEYTRRMGRILISKLSDKNSTRSVDVYVKSILTLSFCIVNWTS